MQTREVSDEPLTVVLFPVKRRLPFFTIDSLPAFREPPAKVLIAALAYEFEKLSVADESLIDGKILQEDLVRGLFIVESKIIVAAFESVLRSRAGSCVTQPKQASFDFRHAFDSHRRWRRGFHRCGELIAQQMLDVINQKLLMLHFMFETKPDEGSNRFRVWQFVERLQKLQHLLIYVFAIGNRIFNRWTRLRATLLALDTRTESFVIGVEVEEILFRINLVTWQVGPQHSLKKP